MRWIIGVDLKGRGRGALAWCQYVAQHTRAADDDRFEAIHVLEERDVRPFSSHVSLGEIERVAREAMNDAVKGSLGAAHIDAIELVHEGTADEALARKISDSADAVLVVGRKAPAAGTGWVRLGRVARRLVRSLPAPVVVVPPDLDPADLGEGPILLATSLNDDSVGAAELAKRLARRWNRRIIVAHVVPGIDDDPPHFVPAATRHQLLAQLRLDGQHGLEVWMRQQGLEKSDAAVATGDVIERIEGIAREEKVALIVVGSRKLSTGARLYTSSIGSDLAGSAPVPVAVVPT